MKDSIVSTLIIIIIYLLTEKNNKVTKYDTRHSYF